MNKEKQKIAIAEACGWKVKRRDITGYNVWEPDAEFPAQLSNNIENKLPDYLNDLNAMHDAEKTLTDAQRMVYISKNLWNMVPNKHIFAHYFSATAALRAEAFLKTIGKWKE
jgi:hypothetical protein